MAYASRKTFSAGTLAHALDDLLQWLCNTAKINKFFLKEKLEVLSMNNNLIEKYVPKKYQHCVNDFYKDIDGYWLELKTDYISTTTQTHTIHELNINDLKKEFKTIIYNIPNVQIPIKKYISLFDTDELISNSDEIIKIANDDEREMIGFAEEEAQLFDITNYNQVEYELDENNNIKFQSVSEALSFLINIGFEVNNCRLVKSKKTLV
ncbi:TPA: hypothetical protein O8991_002647 [Staphylococcus aureus]|nr:hypothetical protein [Staphylococcus aureus]